MLTEKEGLKLLRKHLKNEETRKHSLVAAKVMEQLAARLKMSTEEWLLCGLLHDLDYEEVRGDMNKHGLVASDLLEGLLSKECLQAIRAHDHRTGVKARSILDKALIASDAIARFLEEWEKREDLGKSEELRPETFQRKFEEKPFRKLSYLRERIEICREIGVPLNEFLILAWDVFEKKGVTGDKPT